MESTGHQAWGIGRSGIADLGRHRAWSTGHGVEVQASGVRDQTTDDRGQRTADRLGN